MDKNIQHNVNSGLHPTNINNAVKNITSPEHYKLYQSTSITSVNGKSKTNKASVKHTWKGILTVVCLWFTYLSVNINYSLIGPLFPHEV